jgi:hypothetical protein
MYLATTPYGSFMEMFDFAESPEFGISESVLRQSCLCPVRLRRPLQVVDLTTGRTLKRLSPRGDNRISDGSYEVARRWAHALWLHPANVDGILYRARNAPECFSVALFDRAGGVVVTDCSKNLLQDDHALADILDYLDCPLLP